MRTAESHQQLCCQRFERLSDSAKQGKPRGPEAQHWAAYPARVPMPLYFSPELMDFKSRRVSSFRKNLVELAELELKHAKVSSILTGPSCCLPDPQASRFLPSVFRGEGQASESCPS